MDKEILELLKSMDLKIDRIDKNLQSVVEQTADLTEFRTDVKQQLKEIKNELNNVEIITSSNWNDIAKLKSVK